jgi:hypothetical protein
VPYVVFISHSAKDKWVASQLAKEVSATGAEFFLDSRDIETGDEFDAKIRAALNGCDELLVLLSPTALERPYVWIEIGVAWGRQKRIIGILHGMTTSEIAERDGAPAFLKGIHLRDINDLDAYLAELGERVAGA